MGQVVEDFWERTGSDLLGGADSGLVAEMEQMNLQGISICGRAVLLRRGYTYPEVVGDRWLHHEVMAVLDETVCPTWEKDECQPC